MRSPIYSNSLNAVATATWGSTLYANAVVGHYALPLDYAQLAFGVFAGTILSQDQNAITWSYLLTYDDFSPSSKVDCSLSQTTTTITVTDPNLQVRGGVAAGDIVHLYSPAANVSGPYVVATAPSLTTYTVTSGTSQTVGASFAQHQYWRFFAAPAAITGATTRVGAALSHSTTGPCTGVLLKITARTGGSIVGVIVQGTGAG